MNVMILLFYYKENKKMLTTQFENPMAIFKMVVFWHTHWNVVPIECCRANLFSATSCGDCTTL